MLERDHLAKKCKDFFGGGLVNSPLALHEAVLVDAADLIQDELRGFTPVDTVRQKKLM